MLSFSSVTNSNHGVTARQDPGVFLSCTIAMSRSYVPPCTVFCSCSPLAIIFMTPLAKMNVALLSSPQFGGYRPSGARISSMCMEIVVQHF